MVHMTENTISDLFWGAIKLGIYIFPKSQRISVKWRYESSVIFYLFIYSLVVVS